MAAPEASDAGGPPAILDRPSRTVAAARRERIMTSGAAAAAAIAQAIKASGAIVRVKPEDFRKLAHQNPEALVVHAKGGWMWRRHKYLMGYRGLIFQANAAEPISLPHTCQLIEARRIWVP